MINILAMNKILLLTFPLMLSGALASAQSAEEPPKIEKSITPSALDLENEQLKRELKAPDSKEFSSEDDYLKAKDAWIKRNKSSYDKMVNRSNSDNLNR